MLGVPREHYRNHRLPSSSSYRKTTREPPRARELFEERLTKKASQPDGAANADKCKGSAPPSDVVSSRRDRRTTDGRSQSEQRIRARESREEYARRKTGTEARRPTRSVGADGEPPKNKESFEEKLQRKTRQYCIASAGERNPGLARSQKPGLARSQTPIARISPEEGPKATANKASAAEPSGPRPLRPARSRKKLTPKESEEHLKAYINLYRAEESPQIAKNSAESTSPLEAMEDIAATSKEARRLRATESFEDRLKQKMGIITDVHAAMSDGANATIANNSAESTSPVEAMEDIVATSKEARRLRATESFEDRLKQKMGIITDVHAVMSDGANATIANNSAESTPPPEAIEDIAASSKEARRLRATESFEDRVKEKMGIITDASAATSDNANATADKSGSRERNPVPYVRKQETAHKALESPKAKESRKSHQSLELPRSTKPEICRPRRRRARPVHEIDEAPRNHIEYDHPLMPSLPPPLGLEPTSATVPNSEDPLSSSPPPSPKAGKSRQSKGRAVARVKNMVRRPRRSKRNASNRSIDPRNSLRSEQDMSNGGNYPSGSLRVSERGMSDASIDLTDILRMSGRDAAKGGNHGLSEMCVICLDLPRTHAFVPCGHVCACRECSQILMETTGECPMCNRDAIMAMRVQN